MEDFGSVNLPLNMSGIFEDDQETLPTLPSSQFTNYEAESPVVPSSQDSPHNEDSPVAESSSIWQMRNTARRSWIWQHGNLILLSTLVYV